MASITPEILEEYRQCQQKAQALQGWIWQTAVILGFGSFAAIALVAKTLNATGLSIEGMSAPLVCVLAILSLLAWKRFADRWSSIEQVMYLRMEQIERESKMKMKATLFIRYLDDWTELGRPTGIVRADLIAKHKLTEAEADSLEARAPKIPYERRGIRPMANFVVDWGITTWLLILVLWLLMMAAGGSRLVPLDSILVALGIAYLVLGIIWYSIIVRRP